MGKLTCDIGRVENPFNDKLLSMTREECAAMFLEGLQKQMPDFSVETLRAFFENKLEPKEYEAVNFAIERIDNLGMYSEDFINLIKQTYFQPRM